MSGLPKQRWRAVCAYDGTEFSGWQSQPGGNTIQDFIEARLGEVFSHPVRIHGSGRTDAGVHAKGQVFHFEADWKHEQSKLMRALQTGIPGGIQIVRIAKASPDFHARYSAKGKHYAYRYFHGEAPPWERRYYYSLGRRRLDMERINKASEMLIGTHDFTAFGANRGDGSKDNPVKDMRRLELLARGPRLTLHLEASGFLYKMARSIAGALIGVGLGKMDPENISQILESGKRSREVETAPAQGLWLERVYYRL